MGALFFVGSVVAVLGAALMVARRNPIYGLLFLLMSFSGSAVVFYSLSATFLAVSQVLIYAGAIAVLFLFVLMFVNLRRQGEEQLSIRVGSLAEYDPAAVPEASPSEPEQWRFRLGSGMAALTLFIVMAWVIVSLPESWDSFSSVKAPGKSAAEAAALRESGLGTFGSIKDIGQVMIKQYWLHFEVVGLIVLVGVIGAVVLGKRLTAPTEATKPVDSGHGHGGH